MDINSTEGLQAWASKYLLLSQELLLNVLSLASDHVLNQQNSLHAQKNLNYVGLLIETFKELQRKCANREDELCAIDEELSA